MTKQDVAEFRKLYKEKFGMEVDEQTARKKLSLLVRQMELAYTPITKNQINKSTANKTVNSVDKKHIV